MSGEQLLLPFIFLLPHLLEVIFNLLLIAQVEADGVVYFLKRQGGEAIAADRFWRQPFLEAQDHGFEGDGGFVNVVATVRSSMEGVMAARSSLIFRILILPS